MNRKQYKKYCVSGEIYQEDFTKKRGYCLVKEGIIKELGVGEPPIEPVVTGTIIPMFVNSHTHLGDSIIDFEVSRIEKDELSLKELVGPGGIKHKRLEGASDREILKNIIDSLVKGERSGTGFFSDFREGGFRGSNTLKLASQKTNIPVKIMGRPKEVNIKNIESLLEVADGIGVSSVCDYTKREVDIFKKASVDLGIELAVHAGENKINQKNCLKESGKSEIKESIELDPNYIVHATNPLEGDLQSIYDKDIPVVICPRSNRITGAGMPPLIQMLELGIEVGIGTDNAMLCNPSVLEECRFIYKTFKNKLGKDGAVEIVKSATIGSGDIIGFDVRIKEGHRANMIVIEEKNKGILKMLAGEEKISTICRGQDVILNV